MSHIKYTFSIKDLENFTGIKAHTIRIWEKRYKLLTPERTDGNQRFYDLTNLQKILNIKLLYDGGVKISKIAALEPEQLNEQVVNLVSDMNKGEQALDLFKMSMLKYDQVLFEKTYIQLNSKLSFRRIFLDVFVPLLEHIGYLWQSSSIGPAHEHFISNLIHQKILSYTEKIQCLPKQRDERVYVLYLPHGEIHDLGLLYLHYELTLRGWKSIYLGQSVPLKNLFDLRDIFGAITFVSYFTVEPNPSLLPHYMKSINEELLVREQDQMWAIGRRTGDINQNLISENISTYPGLSETLENLENQ